MFIFTCLVCSAWFYFLLSRRKQNRLHILEKELSCHLLDKNVNETKISEIENEIKEILDSKASGAQVRAWIKF